MEEKKQNQLEEAEKEREKAQESVETKSVEELEEKLKELSQELENVKKEKDELYDRLLRLSAEFDNFRKRMQKEFERFKELANEALIKELLVILDNFERALSALDQGSDQGSFVEGVKLIYKQFKETLKRFGVEEIEASEGTVFDPNVHEAVMKIEDEEKDGVIVQELQKGYKFKGKLLRPSKVAVAKKKE